MSNASEAAGASSRGGWLPFRVAIVIVVVGLLVVTCGSLIAYVLYRGEHSVELLKHACLEQVADTTVREVLRLPATAAQVLALQGDTTLALPAPVRDLAVLHSPLEARVRLFLGKQIDRQTYAARLRRLGAGGGEIESDPSLAVFDALQVLLPTATGDDASENTGWQGDRTRRTCGRTDGSRPLHRDRLGHPGEARGVRPSGPGYDVARPHPSVIQHKPPDMGRKSH